MASAFVLGERFRQRAADLLEENNSPMSQELRAELQNLLQEPHTPKMSFSTARRLKEYLQNTGHHLFLHELLEDSCLLLPEVVKPPRNPQLVARLEKLKARLANQEYDRITRNVNTQEIHRHGTMADFGRDVRSMKTVFVTVFNFLVTVVATFACSYMGSQYLFADTSARVISAVIAASVVGLAELYVLVRTVEGDLGEL